MEVIMNAIRRVLIKISGEALSGDNAPLSAEKIEHTAALISEIHRLGTEIGIVVGGGNIMRGRAAGKIERNRADHMGMLATAINSLALCDALQRVGVPSTVMSAVGMDRFCDEFTARGADSALKQKTVVIFACGSGSPFFSTDTAAALRAAEIHADALLLAKNVDAVYSADPKLVPDAVKYKQLTYDQVIAENLKATDLTAITLCKEQTIPIHVFALSELANVFNGSDTGTIIS